MFSFLHTADTSGQSEPLLSCSFEEPPTTSISINSQRGNGFVGSANHNNNIDLVATSGDESGGGSSDGVEKVANTTNHASINNNVAAAKQQQLPSNQTQQHQLPSTINISGIASSSSSNGGAHHSTVGGCGVGDGGGQSVASETSDPYQVELVGVLKARVARNPIMPAPNSPLLINYEQVGFACDLRKCVVQLFTRKYRRVLIESIS